MTTGRARFSRALGLSLAALGLALGAGLMPRAREAAAVRQADGRPPAAAGGKLRRLYEQWRVGHEAAGGDSNVLIPLGAPRSASTVARGPRGAARLDLVAGTASVEVRGLAPDRTWNVWLLDNEQGGGRGALLDPGDKAWKLGALVPGAQALVLRTRLERAKLVTFEVDAVIVAEAGREEAEPALFGLPRAFQRVFTRARTGTLDLYASAAGALPQRQRGWAERIVALIGSNGAAASAPLHVDVDTVLSTMAEAGADLFLNETFDGNGRTCGTCHPPANNFTIDPAFIATLPASDPLFVAEQVPELSGLEVPALLRSHALVVENVDGFERPGVLRSVPHVLALSQSLSPPICVGPQGCPVSFPDGTQVVFPYGAQTAFVDTTMPEATGFPPVSTDPLVAFPVERTGWSGDGAPGSGSLREFSIGAVIQHFPRTLQRRPGVDFRLPTDDELDALELFQLSLGRLYDPQLSELSFRHPVIARGQQIFMRNDTEGGSVSAGKCQICHFNAGANSTPEVFGEVVSKFGVPRDFFGNQVFSTGVNNLPPGETRAPPGIPRDGGMGVRFMGAGGCINGRFAFGPSGPSFVPEPGTEPGGFGTAAAGGFLPTGFCIEQFNPPPLVEAADTAPFFHNNAFNTLEEAVAFYGSETFNQDPSISLFLGSIDTGGIAIKLDEQAVSDVSHFLRALNALENVRQADELSEGALTAPDFAVAALIDQAWEELKDARMVVEQTGLHATAVRQLAKAIQMNRQAAESSGDGSAWKSHLRSSARAMAAARGELIVE
jgi:cytochrome c peroxidase